MNNNYLTENVDIHDMINIAKTLFGERAKNIKQVIHTENIQQHEIREIVFEEEPKFYDDHDHEWISLSDEKDGPNYIMKQIEPMVRSAPRYKDYANKCRWEEKLYHCVIFPNIRHKYDCFVELHHFPFTLYDIAFILARKIAKENGDINYFNTINDYQLVKEVLRVHLEDQVTLVPLSVTPHKLYHEGLLFIPLDKVNNKWESFMDEYVSYMEHWQIDKINKIRQTTEKMRNRNESDLPVIMQPYITHVTIKGRDYPFLKGDI